jgi:hypothetical protein
MYVKFVGHNIKDSPHRHVRNFSLTKKVSYIMCRCACCLFCYHVALIYRQLFILRIGTKLKAERKFLSAASSLFTVPYKYYPNKNCMFSQDHHTSFQGPKVSFAIVGIDSIVRMYAMLFLVLVRNEISMALGCFPLG